VPQNSFENDEYRTMLQLIAEYAAAEGFFTDTCAILQTATDVQLKEFITKVRAHVGKMAFISTKYNQGKLPTFAQKNNIYLMATPDALANIDVNVLAAAFNVSYADLNQRVIVVDEFPIEGAEALLFDKDFFVCADYVHETSAFYNPEQLATNYYLHHWGVYSVSPFMPVVLFSSLANPTTIPTVVEAVTSLTLAAQDEFGTAVTTYTAGDLVYLVPDLTGTVTPATPGIDVLPDSVTYTFALESSAGVAKTVKATTYVDDNGVLHVQRTGIAAGDELTITATSTYINPSDASDTTAYTASVTLTIA